METRVAFKVDGGEVFAFFPDERHHEDMFASYAHAGQHSLCAKPYFDHRRWARFAQYKPLYDELVSIGYRLKVLNSDFVKVSP